MFTREWVVKVNDCWFIYDAQKLKNLKTQLKQVFKWENIVTHPAVASQLRVHTNEWEGSVNKKLKTPTLGVGSQFRHDMGDESTENATCLKSKHRSYDGK